MAVLVWCGKSIKFNSVCQSIVELNLGSTHSGSSESDVAPVSLQSPTYSVRFSSWKVRRLNQVLHTRCLELDVDWPVHCSGLIFSIGKYYDNHPSFHAGCVVICYTIDLKDRLNITQFRVSLDIIFQWQIKQDTMVDTSQSYAEWKPSLTLYFWMNVGVIICN